MRPNVKRPDERNKPDPPGWTLSAQHAFLGMVIEENGVVMMIARVDRFRRIMPLRWAVVPIPLSRDLTPAPRQMEGALSDGLRQLHGEPLEYGRCFLCLPPWCTETRAGSGSIDLGAQGHDPDRPAVRRVTADDVQDLVRRVCQQNVPPACAVVDVVPQHYVLDNGCRVSDPLGSLTRTLDLEACLIVTDYGTARGLLDALNSLRLRVDMMTSPYAATGELLLPSDKEAGSVLVDAGARYTCCSFFQDGILAHAVLVPCGLEEAVAEAAGRLGMEEEDLVRVVRARREWLLQPEVYAALVVALPGGRSVRVADVDAAVRAGAGLFWGRVQTCLDEAIRARHLRVKRLWLAGDESVLLRALKGIGAQRFPAQGGQVAMQQVHCGTEAVLPAQARMAGLLARGALASPALQPFLHEYNRVPGDPVLRFLLDEGRVVCRQVSSAWRAAAPRLRESLGAVRIPRFLSKVPHWFA